MRELFSLEAEAAVAGSLLAMDEVEQDEALTMLSLDDLTHPHCRLVYSTVSTLRMASRPADIISVMAHISGAGPVDDDWDISVLASLRDMAVGPKSYSSLCQTLSSLSRLRAVRAGLAEVISSIDSSDGPGLEDILDRTLALATDTAGAVGSEASTASEVMAATSHEVHRIISSDGGIVGVRTGFPLLDYMIRGLRPGQMWVLAARPGVGKTALGLQMAVQAAASGHPTLIYSLEMSAVELGMRLVSHRGRVEISGGMSRPEIERMVEAADYIGKLPLTIDDAPSGLGVPELRSRTRKQIKRHGVQLVIIDYLQLMRPTSRKQGTREREIAELSWAIKGLAREMGVAVVLISQLNRQSEHRSNREPTLSDLRDSGSIEQDADGVMLLYVPEEDKRGNVTLKLAKNRHGAVGQVFLDWDAPTVTFAQIDTRPAAPSTEARHFSKGGYSRD